MIMDTFTVGMLQCNCTILAADDSNDAIVVDPGDEAEQILERLEQHGLELRQIICTHAHIDHVGAIHELQRRTGAAASIHEHDLFLFDDLDMQASWLGMPAPEKGHIERFLTDGDMVSCPDLELEVVHTPGHTPGSLTFHLEDDRPILFTGDTLFQNSIGRTDLPGGSMPDILKSIESRLMTYEDETLVIPGHGPYTTIGREKADNPFLR